MIKSESRKVKILKLCEIIKIIPDLKKEQQTRYKGQNGKTGIIGGSKKYTGAPFYSGISSLKAGGDLCFIYCNQESAQPIKSYSPELIVIPSLDLQSDQIEFLNQLKTLHSIVIGPGLDRQINTLEYITSSIILLKNHQVTLIFDADYLWFLSQKDYSQLLIQQLIDSLIHQNVIITPNNIELQRLLYKYNEQNIYNLDYQKIYSLIENMGLENNSIIDVDQNNIGLYECFEALIQLSKKLNVIIYLKGFMDIICRNNKIYVCNFIGGLKRTGGLGDVTAGAIAVYSHWAIQQKQDIIFGLIFASYITKTAQNISYAQYLFSLTTPDIIQNIQKAFQTIL